MNVQAPKEQPPEVEQLVDALLDGELAKYLVDTDTANDLIKEIAGETGLPRAAVRIAFKLLAPMLVKQTQAGAGWFSRRLVSKSAGVLASVPGYRLVAGKLMALRGKLDADVARRSQLEAILAGDRPATDIEHAEGLSKELRIGLRQLADLAEVRVHIDARFDEVLDRLNPQPLLTLKLLEGDDANRLKFGARRVPLLGREAEMAALRAFLETDERFSWWLMTGSGGQGKSRLALELCLRAGTAWRAGFLPETSSFDGWDAWQPESATLIVVDYVAMRPERVRGVITSLLRRAQTDPLEAPVRVLLLERSKEGNWWEKLIGSDQTGYAIEQSQFDAEPLDLGRMTEDDLWQTVASILAEAGTPLPDRAETLAALRQIDPEGRPLFAAFAADALASGSQIRHWDRERLLRDVLKREQRRQWVPAGVTKPYENLLCLATMTGGIPLEMLLNPRTDIEVPNLEGFEPGTYGAMTGLQSAPAGDLTLLPSLQPDILGEFFVLEYLRPPNVGTHQPAEKFRHATWNMPIPLTVGFWDFLNRCKDDFLNHETLSLLLEPPRATEQQREWWAMLAVNVIHAYGNAKQPDKAEACLVLLDHLAADHPNEAQLRLRLAQGAVNLINAYGNVGHLGEAEACLALLRQLEGDHPDEPEVRLELAKGAFNLINASINAGQLGQAEACLALLRQLEVDHPEEIEVRLELAKGVSNMVDAYANAGRLDKAEACLILLDELEGNHIDEAEVRLRLARCSVKLTSSFGRAGEVARAEACLSLLKRLGAAHADEVEVRFCVANGAVNLINAYGNAGQLGQAEACLTLLRQLEGDHPDEPEVWLGLAQGAFNLINASINAGQLGQAEACLTLLRQLEAVHPDEPEVRLELTKGAFNLINAHDNEGRSEEARRVALENRVALLSAEFEKALRQQGGDEAAEQFLAWLRSLADE